MGPYFDAFALFHICDCKIDYGNSCVTKRCFDSTKVLYPSVVLIVCFVT